MMMMPCSEDGDWKTTMQDLEELESGDQDLSSDVFKFSLFRLHSRFMSNEVMSNFDAFVNGVNGGQKPKARVSFFAFEDPYRGWQAVVAVCLKEKRSNFLIGLNANYSVLNQVFE